MKRQPEVRSVYVFAHASRSLEPRTHLSRGKMTDKTWRHYHTASMFIEYEYFFCSDYVSNTTGNRPHTMRDRILSPFFFRIVLPHTRREYQYSDPKKRLCVRFRGICVRSALRALFSDPFTSNDRQFRRFYGLHSPCEYIIRTLSCD